MVFHSISWNSACLHVYQAFLKKFREIKYFKKNSVKSVKFYEITYHSWHTTIRSFCSITFYWFSCIFIFTNSSILKKNYVKSNLREIKNFVKSKFREITVTFPSTVSLPHVIQVRPWDLTVEKISWKQFLRFLREIMNFTHL